ncbi:BAG family molecular chaperone regulator 4 [Carica papaya]|uniref:BAG family molecular chaperone regulator 4 n=1 Tax=Carica papaya TaxID=3649 RepID=UPI000B8CD66E|nr:BAG family molecular chaperone regulator 4 [Carica papaya]
MNNLSGKNEEAEWEVRPGGMLVQRREENGHDHQNHHHRHHHHEAAASGSTIKINVSHGPAQHEVSLPANSTFGDVKKVIAQKTGLEPGVQKILFRGQEKEDNEELHTAGVKDKSKVLLLKDPESKEKNVEHSEESEARSKALAAVAGVREEIDKLSERVAALEVAVNSGTKVVNEEFDMSAELLMRQLLKLDSIEAEGEAKMQRKAEVCRVQSFHDTLDNLKARNSNPVINSSKTVSLTTKWETFESGMGSLEAPPPATTSTKVTQDWEQFD